MTEIYIQFLLSHCARMLRWPSNLVMSTHCVLYAQMIIHGEEKGVHVFMVQLRDEDLRPLPGVEVGDIGTKAGDNFVDIGYLRLQVRNHA